MADTQEQKAAGGAAEAEAIDLGEFSELLEKDFRVKESEGEKLKALVSNLALAATEKAGTATISGNAVKSIKSLIAGIDSLLTDQMNVVMHAPEVRQIEGTWRGLRKLDWRAEEVPPMPAEPFAPPAQELMPWLNYGFGVSWQDVGDAVRDRVLARFAPKAGPVLADGGRWVPGLGTRLSDDEWEDLVWREFR